MAKVQKNKLESRKSHSWWWDSHVSPKNSKWLAENLEEMDQSVNRMLRLIEEDGDSFAKKAEMYYHKRPELVSNVEEFYRMYRSLAERYDNLTGELRKSMPSDLRSQGSTASDSGSDLTSSLPTFEAKPSRRQRPPGFDFFLGSGGGSADLSQKESDATSSSSDSESESDAASVANFLNQSLNGDGEVLRRRITELEAEVLELKEKLQVAEENPEALSRAAGIGNHEVLLGRITWYDEELKVANERLKQFEEDKRSLKVELESKQGQVLGLQENIAGLETDFLVSSDKIKALEDDLSATRSKLKTSEEEVTKMRLEIENTKSESESKEVDGLEIYVMDLKQRIKALEEELEIKNDKLHLSEEEIVRLKTELVRAETLVATNISLQVQLEFSQKEIGIKQHELDVEKKRMLDLQEQIKKLKENVSDHDHEIEELKLALSKAEEVFSLEKSHLHEKISIMSESQTQLEAKLKDWELKAKSLEEEIKRREAQKTESEAGMEVIRKSFEALKLKYEMLMAERDKLNVDVLRLAAEVSARDDCIQQKDEHLHRLHLEHVHLISESERLHKFVNHLKARAKALEEEVERQRIVILDGAEEKREVIRQLCFSLEHYKNGYRRLRQAFLVNKRPAILAV